MSRALLAACVLAAPLALAQVDGGVAGPIGDAERRDLEAKVDAARREVKELREEMRAQLATQSVAQGWQEDWVEEKRKLELVTFDGYLRVRPDLFYKFDLGRGPDSSGYYLWPRSPTSAVDRTNAGVNMRFRFEPTLNISEEVRIRAQIDALDNLVWGSTADYVYSRNAMMGYYYDRNDLSVFSNGQAPMTAGVNSLANSIALKRVWGEVSTPIGILKFGRMGSNWGLGMMHNDGNCLDCDWGDTVDRVMFTAEPIAGYYISPMIDFNLSGLLSTRMPEGGQPFDLTNSDGVTSFILAAARRDTDQEAKAKLASGQTVLNYGIHFTYRTQRAELASLASPLPATDGSTNEVSTSAYVSRQASLFMPDLWGKVESKNWRIEAEVAATMGWFKPFTDASVDRNVAVWEFGGVLQGEYKLLNGDLEIGAEVGFATGDNQPGFGNYPRRTGTGAGGMAGPGDYDGRHWNCSTATSCTDTVLRGFRFNRDYRVDMILYRELLGGVTDSLYIKPRLRYRVTQGLYVFVAGIYSRAMWPMSTPSSQSPDPTKVDANLGIELNGGARYETEDGFFAQVQYGILFPLAGFNRYDQNGNTEVCGAAGCIQGPLDFAQALRASLGIKF